MINDAPFSVSELRSVTNRFFSFVNKNGPTPDHKPDLGACWIWGGALKPAGYGVFSFRGLSLFAHRVSWMMANGEIPSGLFIIHKCDLPCCVRPDHLMAGTQSDNISDAFRKGRMRGHLKAMKGSKNGMAKIDESDIPKILSMLGAGMTQVEIAKQFGISNVSVRLIGIGATWKHVPRYNPHQKQNQFSHIKGSWKFLAKRQ